MVSLYFQVFLLFAVLQIVEDDKRHNPIGYIANGVVSFQRNTQPYSQATGIATRSYWYWTYRGFGSRRSTSAGVSIGSPFLVSLW